MNDSLEEAKALQRKYQREWRKNNKEKVKAINERYWLKKLKNLKQREEEN